MTTYVSSDRGPRIARSVFSTSLATLLLGLVAGGCGDPSLGEEGSTLEWGTAASALRKGIGNVNVNGNGNGNGNSPTFAGSNGMATNGMATNGMATNGLRTSGLIANAMNGTAFINWFNQDPTLANMVMHYVVGCAVTDGSSRIWTNPTTGIQYVWQGVFGLTPGWASGQPANEVEQQLITACLAAHTNKYGLQVPISIQGRDALGSSIPVGLLEFITFGQREACFFGNIFTGEGVFAGSDALLSNTISSVRACGLETPGTGDKCAPIHHVDPCSQICTVDSLGSSYASCTYNGKSYQAITTRIRTLDLNVCGDGVCQISESCGTGLTPDSCMDCGPCP